MSAGLGAQRLEQGLDGLLRGLLGGEAAPLEVAVLEGMAGVTEIGLPLAEPIEVAIAYGCALP